GLLERRVDEQRPDDQEENDPDRDQEVVPDEMRPGVDLVVARSRRFPDRDLHPLALDGSEDRFRFRSGHGYLGSASSRSALRRADQKIRMMQRTKKNGMVSTRARGKTNVSTIRRVVTMLPVSSLGIACYSAGPEKPS